MKRCSVCRESKDASEFYKNRTIRDGLQSMCIPCSKRYCEAHRRASGMKERKKVDWESGTFACSSCKRTLPLSEFHVRKQRGGHPRSTCKACQRAKYQEWAKTDHGRAWRTEYQRSKMHNNPEYYAAQRAILDRNNARRRGAVGAGERFTRAEIFERDKGRCHLCGKRARKSEWDLDHVIPISKGGSHTRDNVAVSHPECNGRKLAALTHLF